MRREPWNWDLEDLALLVGQPESLRLEFKQSELLNSNHANTTEASKNLSRAVSALANTEGGVIVIGIEEEKMGKSRVAKGIDEGVDFQYWWPERLQSIIESNISPYLTGIKIRRVFTSESKDKGAFVIHVPSGTTAYQANDHKYYGRSEFETKSLPDHEVRMRMFRGRQASASLLITKCMRRTIKIKGTEPLKSRMYPPRIGKAFYNSTIPADCPGERQYLLSETDELTTYRYSFEISLYNNGGVNIREFKIVLSVWPSEITLTPDTSWSFKDGWDDWRRPAGFLDTQKHGMQVNVYPKDTFCTGTLTTHLFQEDSFASLGATIDWTIYLADALPAKGLLSLAEHSVVCHIEEE